MYFSFNKSLIDYVTITIGMHRVIFRCSLDTRGAIVSLAFWPMVRTFLLRNSDFNAVYFLRISCRTSASIHGEEFLSAIVKLI
jgi:hypothetical protein